VIVGAEIDCTLLYSTLKKTLTLDKGANLAILACRFNHDLLNLLSSTKAWELFSAMSALNLGCGLTTDISHKATASVYDLVPPGGLWRRWFAIHNCWMPHWAY
jgi:hypothetical protein